MRHAQSTFDLDDRIRRIASAQLGLLTVDQAARCGVDKHALARRREAGALIPVFPGVMRLAPFDTTPLQRTLAASLAVPGSMIAATSAAIVHKMPVPAGVITGDAVLSVGPRRLVRINGITTVRQTITPPGTKWTSSHVTTPAATLLLLPRFVHDDTVERCLDHCLAHRLTTVQTVRKLISGTPPHAIHRRQLLLELLDARSDGIGHRSGKEQTVARWLTRASLKGWVRNYQVNVGADDEIEVDFGWPKSRIGLEVSPFFTHGSRVTQERDAERRRRLVVNDWRVVEALDHDIENERAFAGTIATLRALGAS